LTTHYLEEAEALCQRIAMLKQGKVVALDTTANLLSRFGGTKTQNGEVADLEFLCTSCLEAPHEARPI